MAASSSVIAAFSEIQTERLTGITRRQLRYWDNTCFYSPSYAEKNRRVAFSRIYSFKDIVALRVLSALRNQYQVSLQHLREVSERLSHLPSDPDRWASVRLYVHMKHVIWNEPNTQLPQEIVSGQYIAPIQLEEFVADTKEKVRNLIAPRDDFKVGSVERSRYVAHNAYVISGTRIPVNAIKRFAEAGYTVDQILQEYPDITEEDVGAAVGFDASAA